MWSIQRKFYKKSGSDSELENPGFIGKIITWNLDFRSFSVNRKVVAPYSELTRHCSVHSIRTTWNNWIKARASDRDRDRDKLWILVGIALGCPMLVTPMLLFMWVDVSLSIEVTPITLCLTVFCDLWFVNWDLIPKVTVQVKEVWLLCISQMPIYSLTSREYISF